MNRLRPINLPLPVEVEVGPEGEPVRLTWRGRQWAVIAVVDRWRIDDEWWRIPIARLYRRLLLSGDHTLTVFEDLVCGRWYAQRYELSAVSHQPVDQASALRRASEGSVSHKKMGARAES